jgi:hypothetical protein
MFFNWYVIFIQVQRTASSLQRWVGMQPAKKFPWCRHCVRRIPQWIILSQIIQAVHTDEEWCLLGCYAVKTSNLTQFTLMSKTFFFSDHNFVFLPYVRPFHIYVWFHCIIMLLSMYFCSFLLSSSPFSAFFSYLHISFPHSFHICSCLSFFSFLNLLFML